MPRHRGMKYIYTSSVCVFSRVLLCGWKIPQSGKEKKQKIKLFCLKRNNKNRSDAHHTFFSEKVHRLFRGLAHFQPTKRKKGFRLAAVV